MEIQLSKSLPTLDGFYLVKFSIEERPHLVVIRTVGNNKQIITENGKRLYFNEFPVVFWSDNIKFSCN